MIRKMYFLLMLVPVFLACRPVERPPVLSFDNTTLQKTRVVPVPDLEESADGNILWSPSFMLAWKELQESVLGSEVLLETPPVWADSLNTADRNQAGLDPEDYFAAAGFVRDGIIPKIQEEGQRILGKPVSFPYAFAPDDIVAYSCFARDLKFNPVFETIKDHYSFNGGRKVRYFGINEYKPIRHAGHNGHLVIFEDNINFDGNNYIVQITGENGKDEILFAKIPWAGSLRKTYESEVSMILASEPKGLLDMDSLAIPVFNFDIDYGYTDMLGQRLLNEGFKQYFCRDARQAIAFSLDECGASLKSSARISFAKSAPRAYIFNEPFLLIMRKKGSVEPYFLMWVENDELMAVP